MSGDLIIQPNQVEPIEVQTGAIEVFRQLWADTFSRSCEYMMNVTPPPGWSIATSKEQGVPNQIIGIATMLDPTLVERSHLLSSIREAGNLQGHENLRLAVFRYSDKVDGSETTRIELAFHNHRIMVHLFEDGVVSFERHIINLETKDVEDYTFLLVDSIGRVCDSEGSTEEVDVQKMFTQTLELLETITDERQYSKN